MYKYYPNQRFYLPQLEVLFSVVMFVCLVDSNPYRLNKFSSMPELAPLGEGLTLRPRSDPARRLTDDTFGAKRSLRSPRSIVRPTTAHSDRKESPLPARNRAPVFYKLYDLVIM